MFDREAQEAASSYRELPLSYPRPGWVEQDSEGMFRLTLVVVREALESAGLGAAFAAGVTAGLWELSQLSKLVRTGRRFEPRMPEKEREKLLSGWQAAVERAKGWAKGDA